MSVTKLYLCERNRIGNKSSNLGVHTRLACVYSNQLRSLEKYRYVASQPPAKFY
jgi:hypothetical protein